MRDADGRIVRHIEGSVEAGFHRVAWDLRFPTLTPWQPPDAEPPWRRPQGALALR